MPLTNAYVVKGKDWEEIQEEQGTDSDDETVGCLGERAWGLEQLKEEHSKQEVGPEAGAQHVSETARSVWR